MTTTDGLTQARAGTAPPNLPHSTRRPKPLAPPMIIRTRLSHLSSRAEATGSFLIQQRVRHDENPCSTLPPSSLNKHCCFPAASLSHFPVLGLYFSSDSCFLPVLSSFSFCVRMFFCNHFLSVLPAPSSTHFLHPLQLQLCAFCFSIVCFLGCHDVTLLRGRALASLYLPSDTEGNDGRGRL